MAGLSVSAAHFSRGLTESSHLGSVPLYLPICLMGTLTQQSLSSSSGWGVGWRGWKPSETRCVNRFYLEHATALVLCPTSASSSPGGGQEYKIVYLIQCLCYEFMQVSNVGPQSVYLSLNTKFPSSLLRLVDEEGGSWASFPGCGTKANNLSEALWGVQL